MNIIIEKLVIIDAEIYNQVAKKKKPKIDNNQVPSYFIFKITLIYKEGGTSQNRGVKR
jgi:hypothetical protein